MHDRPHRKTLKKQRNCVDLSEGPKKIKIWMNTNTCDLTQKFHCEFKYKILGPLPRGDHSPTHTRYHVEHQKNTFRVGIKITF